MEKPRYLYLHITSDGYGARTVAKMHPLLVWLGIYNCIIDSYPPDFHRRKDGKGREVGEVQAGGKKHSEPQTDFFPACGLLRGNAAGSTW